MWFSQAHEMKRNETHDLAKRIEKQSLTNTIKPPPSLSSKKTTASNPLLHIHANR